MKFLEPWTPKLPPPPGLKVKTEERPAAPNVSIMTEAIYSQNFNPDVTYGAGKDKWLLKMKSPEEITEHLASLLPEVKDQNPSQEAELDPDALLKELHAKFLADQADDLEEEAISGLMEKAGEMEADHPEAWESLKTDAYYDKIKRSEEPKSHEIPEVEALELLWATKEIQNEGRQRGLEVKGDLVGATTAEQNEDVER